MYNFRRGQKVVCVDDTPRYGGATVVGVKYGRVYTVAGIVDCLGGPGINLVEESVPRGYKGFFPDRFRPAVDRKENLGVFYKMLKPNKSKLETV